MPWYEIRNSLAGTTQLRLFDDIGEGGVTARDFTRQLDAIGGPLEVHINSRGGDLHEALAIYNVLRSRGGVTVIIDGLAASAASVVAMAADPGRLLIGEHAQVMVHSAWTSIDGNAGHARRIADDLDQQDATLAAVYAGRSGKPSWYWLDAMKAETWYTGQAAVDAGLADEVLAAPAFPVAAQARRYVTTTKAQPSTMAELGAWVADNRNSGAAEFHAAYTSALKRSGADEDVAEQIRLQRPRERSTAAMAARYNPQAPGARAYGRTFSSLGEFLNLISMPRGKGLDRLRINASFAEEVPDAGGFLVPEELRSQILTWTLEEALIRPSATVIPMGTLRTGVPGVDDTSHASGVLGGVSLSWVEEGASLPQTTGGFQRVTLDAKKLGGVNYLPSELVRDAPAIGAYFRAALPAAVAWHEDEAFIQETGAGVPEGILNAPAAIQVTRAASSTIGDTDIAGMVARMLPQSLRRGCWLAGTDTLVKLLEVFHNFGSATTGVTSPPMWLDFGPDGQPRLLGRPLYVTEHVSALGTTGDLVFIDCSFYLIGDRLELRIDPSEHLEFQNDQIVYRVTERLDGRMWLQQAVTPKRGANTLSPLVVLN